VEDLSMSKTPSADRIEQVAFGFTSSKVLFSAIEFGLFTDLAKESMDAADIQKRCGLHPRGARDFLDTLVALGMLERRGETYSKHPRY
jgi:Dimerisation domain